MFILQHAYFTSSLMADYKETGKIIEVDRKLDALYEMIDAVQT